MNASKLVRYICTVSLLLSLCACGYSLRGNDQLSAKFNSVLLSSQQPNSEFSRLLRRSLEISEVTVLPAQSSSADEDLLILEIGSEQVVSRPVSVNPRARAAQYEMRLSIDIALRKSGEVLISPETISVERSYFEDIQNINGNQEEVEIISAEMRRELVNQLIRRLAAV